MAEKPLNGINFPGLDGTFVIPQPDSIEDTGYPGCYYRMVDGVQEWMNPPMEIGVEYRTTERYTGKAVYTMLLDCGTVPGAGAEKQIRHEIFNINLVLRCTGTLSSGNTLPLDREGYGTISCMATPTEIILRAGADNASLSWLTAHVQIWYTIEDNDPEGETTKIQEE